MSAFRPSSVAPAQIEQLVTDPDLAAAKAALQAAFDAAVAPKASQASVDALGATLAPVINTRASQASVDNLGATLGTAITLATADKATSVALAAVRADILAGQGTLASAVGQATEHTATRSAVTVARDSVLTAITAARDFVVNAVNTARDAILGVQATATALAGVRTDVLAGQNVLATAAQVTAARASIEGLQSTAVALAAVRTDVLAGQGTLATAAQVTAARASIEGLQATAITAASNQAALLAAITASGGSKRLGEVTRFPANQVPADHTRLADTNFIPSGGVAIVGSAASIGNLADIVYIDSGANIGAWRFSLDRFRRYDIATNVMFGPEYPMPIAAPNTTAAVVVAFGTKIYVTGVATTRAFVFDTSTLFWSEVASLPRDIARCRGVPLGNGRILIAAFGAIGLTITQAANPFWLYDIIANTAPVEVIVSLPITRFQATFISHFMFDLPSGKVLLMDNAPPASGNGLSCLLTVTGNSIAVSVAADTGQIPGATNYGVIQTETGVLNCQPAYRAYSEATSWVAGAQPFVHGIATFFASQYVRGVRVPGLGWLLGTSGNFTMSMILTGAPAVGSIIVEAKKN